MEDKVDIGIFDFEQSKLKETKTRKVNKAVSFNSIKKVAMELFYKESDHNLIIEKLTELFLMNTSQIRKNKKSLPRSNNSGFKKW